MYCLPDLFFGFWGSMKTSSDGLDNIKAAQLFSCSKWLYFIQVASKLFRFGKIVILKLIIWTFPFAFIVTFLVISFKAFSYAMTLETREREREREILEEDRSPEKMKREVKSNFAFCKINFNQNLWTLFI